MSLNIQPGCLYMDLLRPDDLERNKQLIVAGYGRQEEEFKRNFEVPLKFSKQNVYMEHIDVLNKTIYHGARYSKTCQGMS